MDHLQHENFALLKGRKILCGIDEVGRGPLAGPVVASCVICPLTTKIQNIDDSKKVLPHKRLKTYFKLLRNPHFHFGIGVVEAVEIDQINIHQATLFAMKRAYENLAHECDFALIDGIHKPSLPIDMQTIIKGDQNSLLIGAASIIAKVTRDRYMEILDLEYPQYGFAKHKGYGTKRHLEAIAKHGPIENVHRFSFAPVKKIELNTPCY